MTHFLAKNDILTENIEQSLVLMDLNANVYLKLNPTARWIWENIQKPMTLEALVQKALDTFKGVSSKKLFHDFQYILDVLQKQNLLDVIQGEE